MLAEARYKMNLVGDLGSFKAHDYKIILTERNRSRSMKSEMYEPRGLRDG